MSKFSATFLICMFPFLATAFAAPPVRQFDSAGSPPFKVLKPGGAFLAKTLQGGSEADDPYVAFDGALGRIAKQLRRYKRRLTNHHKGHGHNDALSVLQYVIEPENEDEEMSKDAQPAIIAEMATEIATLSVSEAVMRMDLADVLVVMFQNKASGGLNVVYRRQDGNVGWIDPANTVERTGSNSYVRPLR